jgi:hypothetical protein
LIQHGLFIAGLPLYFTFGTLRFNTLQAIFDTVWNVESLKSLNVTNSSCKLQENTVAFKATRFRGEFVCHKKSGFHQSQRRETESPLRQELIIAPGIICVQTDI